MAQLPRTHEYLTHENQIIFITTKTFDNHKLFTNDAFCLILQDELFFYVDQYNVELLTFVIMPNHLHCLIWPQGDKTFSDYMQSVKGSTAHEMIKHLHSNSNRHQHMLVPIKGNDKKLQDPGHARGLKHKIWQKSFFPYLINRPSILEHKLEYITNNPVEAGLVERPEDYPWLYVNSNIYEIA